MTLKPITVLLVEDNEADACFIEELLSSVLYQVKHCESLASAYEISKDEVDVILLDLSLPDGHGLQTCMNMVDFAPEIPIIILTGYDNEALGLAAVKIGAQDFILKQDINENTLSRSIRYSIERTAWEKGVHKSAAQARLAEAEAREAAANLKLSLRASKTGVWLWNFLDNTLSADEQVLTLFGLEQCHMGSVQAFFDRIHIDDRGSTIAIIQAAIDHQGGYQTEFRVRWPDGSDHYIASSGQVIEEPNGDPFRMAGICTDLTKQKEEQETAKRLLVLEQHEDFIATLTHDLKNPLIGADRLLAMLISGEFGNLADEPQKMLTLIKQSNADMLGLIQNLLEVYSFDAGAPSLNYAQVDLEALAVACVSQLSAIAREAGVNVTVNFATGDHTISADLIAMRRILMNLLGNAIKFTVSGGEVVISGHKLGSIYILEVEDTGSGIPKQELDLLFRRYSQTALAKTCGAGTGLGLYLCRQLVEAHGGQISCTSDEGIGSNFKMVLPTSAGVDNAKIHDNESNITKLLIFPLNLVATAVASIRIPNV